MNKKIQDQLICLNKFKLLLDESNRMEFNPYVNFSQYYIEDIKKQSEIINSDLQFIEINTNINCEITNNWIKCKESMTKKEYQFVFDFWA